ncbi:hypothetical protein J2Z79_000249 [Symbiobacterium terraclitae]|uniref:Uncharacterized protein n=1 Tax=Symbiobacterium terraclitae TaxID=557451 RepID=A0ABS4JPS2_9FIRM|nr:hypothetical protein [Symbiobacterium terraclitae]MBP2016876.1 hypothetical protein [Symbiobacterium terraclitae]
MDRPAARTDWRAEAEREAIESFQDRHGSLADRVERVLMRLVVLGLVVLGLAQSLGLGRFGLISALEGVPVQEVSDWIRRSGQ